MVCILKNDMRLRTASVMVLDLHDKHRPKCSNGRPKQISGRSISEGAPSFGNLSTYKDSALRIFGRNLPVCGEAALQMHVGKAF